jgi:tetratricopeptide (TPR) repeat protein
VAILSESSNTQSVGLETILANQRAFDAQLADLETILAKHSTLYTRMADLDTILANQRRLGNLFLWLLLPPSLIAIAMVVMFFVLAARVTDVTSLTRQSAIERYYQLDNNPTMAITQYEKLLAEGESAAILARLGVLYFEKDPDHPDSNKNQAIQVLEKAKQLDSKYWEIYRNLTYIYVSVRPGETLRSEDAKNAIKSGEKAVELNPNDARTYSNLAWVYATSTDPGVRDLSRAEAYAKKANDLTNGQLPDVLETLVQVDLSKGGQDDRENALKLLCRAIVFAPNAEMKRYRKHFEDLFPDKNPDKDCGSS